jgi:ATP-dependent DNA helicase RecG
MGLPINIEDLLHGRVVERDRIEYKEGWNPEPVMHTQCAFANDFHNVGGGYLFIGVAEKDGRPVLPPAGLSVRQLDDLQKKIVEIGHRIRPAYVPVVEPYVIDGTGGGRKRLRLVPQSETIRSRQPSPREPWRAW